ncbi:MAG TPA: amidase family protein [Candidatus Solibacter sp.]|nr:amidase family protein [Candidatus Solibacter sp.]
MLDSRPAHRLPRELLLRSARSRWRAPSAARSRAPNRSARACAPDSSARYGRAQRRRAYGAAGGGVGGGGPVRGLARAVRPDVLSLFDQGRLVPAVDYVNAQRLRHKMRREFDALWQKVDCLFTPTTPNTAPKIGDTTVHLGGQDEDVRLPTTRLMRGINAS